MSDSEMDDYAMSQDESDGYELEVTKKVPYNTQGATKRWIKMAETMSRQTISTQDMDMNQWNNEISHERGLIASLQKDTDLVDLALQIEVLLI